MGRFEVLGRTSRRKKWILAVIVLLAIIAVLVSLFFFFLYSGKKELVNISEEKNEFMEELQDQGMGEDGMWRYNDDLLTFLIIGTDRVEGKNYLEDGSLNHQAGGQADAIFLATLDSDSGKVTVISLPRTTMTSIIWCDEKGEKEQEIIQAICLQYAYGDGSDENIKRTVEAVRNIFYRVPIHGYIVLNMDRIPEANDAVGGVEVTLMDQISKEEICRVDEIPMEEHEGLEATEVLRSELGTKITLRGRNAYYYLRWRNKEKKGSAMRRLERQKQYIRAYVGKVSDEVKKDPLFAVKLYLRTKDLVDTDIDTREALYLMTAASGADLSSVEMKTVEGVVTYRNNYMEYYADEDKLKQLVCDVFCKGE